MGRNDSGRTGKLAKRLMGERESGKRPGGGGGRNDLGRKVKWAKRPRGERESGRNDPDSLPTSLKSNSVGVQLSILLNEYMSSLMTKNNKMADGQADLSLRWAHRSLCWFCHEAAQLWISHSSLDWLRSSVKDRWTQSHLLQLNCHS